MGRPAPATTEGVEDEGGAVCGAPLSHGLEWLVDAYGCDPDRLRAVHRLEALFDTVVTEVGLHPLGPAHWHVFPATGGITGLLILSESHLACHTFPERGFAALNLYCCRRRAEWPWARQLQALLGARHVVVRSAVRGDEGLG